MCPCLRTAPWVHKAKECLLPPHGSGSYYPSDETMEQYFPALVQMTKQTFPQLEVELRRMCVFFINSTIRIITSSIIIINCFISSSINSK